MTLDVLEIARDLPWIIEKYGLNFDQINKILEKPQKVKVKRDLYRKSESIVKQ